MYRFATSCENKPLDCIRTMYEAAWTMLGLLHQGDS
jgi:hypothetical protein